jgi:hypothetical protein
MLNHKNKNIMVNIEEIKTINYYTAHNLIKVRTISSKIKAITMMKDKIMVKNLINSRNKSIKVYHQISHKGKDRKK